MRAVILLAFAAIAAAKDCTAIAKYPDGSEVERECIVEGEGKAGKAKSGGSKGGISTEFAWMKDTRWHWNNWRDVIFRADGSFLAPAEGCEREGSPKCRWSADEDRIYVNFGGAGRHTLTVTDDQQSMYGSRDSDGDEVSATRK